MPSSSPIFERNIEPRGLVLTFSSVMENIDRACAECMTFLAESAFAIDPKHFPLNLLIREGLTNAVKHGNKGNPEKLVRFSAFLEKSHISLIIEDQGTGFDWKNMDVSIRRPDQETGRGLWIIRQYAHEYRFNTKGNILHLKHMIARGNI